MVSTTQIANKALDNIGYGPINSLTDNTKAASLANRLWPLVRDEVLRAHTWNFAVKRATTAPDSAAPDWGYTYQHTLPTDLLRLVEILNMHEDDYQVEGRKILADSDTLRIRYIYQVEDTTLYDSCFVDAVAAKLAYEMAEQLTESTAKKQSMLQAYDIAMESARKVDGMENPQTKFEEDPWLRIRY